MISTYANSVSLDNIDGYVLDSFLHSGWFRNGTKIFTTHFLNYNDEIHDAIWLRINLQRLEFTNSQKKLFASFNRFRIVQRKFGLTQEKEELFQKYKSSVSFTISPSLSFLLFDNKHQNVYDTHEVAIYDGKDLIGIGIYDKGKKYAAGITCLYDPLYKKYSIGKFLMLYKMLLLKESGLEYFYPGYFTPNQKVFEYKLHLSPQQTEYFDFINKVWLPLSDYDKSNTMLLEKENKLSLLSTKLYRIDIPHKVCKYPYFDAALNPTFQANYELQEPTFILLKDYQNENDFVLIIIYDVQQKKYKLIECYVLGFPSYPIAGENYYNEAVLQVCDVLETFTEIGTKMRLNLKKILK